MAAGKYTIQVDEKIGKEGDKIVSVTYIYKEKHADGIKNLAERTVAREEYEKHAAKLPTKPIAFDQFIKVLKPFMMGDFAEDAEIKEAFQVLDADKSGKVDLGELAAFMPVILPAGKPEMLTKHIEKADKDKDKTMDLAEFTDFINKGIGRDIAAGKL